MDAAAYYWPELFRDLDEQRRSTLRAALRRSRPRLVEGFEAMVMARLLAEDPSSVGEHSKRFRTLLPSAALALVHLLTQSASCWSGRRCSHSA